ncbi:reverse transcriptase domain-containing protein [Tanacetum coccineum]
MALEGARFLVVAIDYFTKWVEAKPLISTTGKHMERFVWEYIVCRFGAPQIVISDNEKQFSEGTFPIFCQKLRILQAFTSVYHPQVNEQVEVTNREVVKGMERRLGKTHQGWVDELPQVLWAHRTTLKSSNGETPFRAERAYARSLNPEDDKCGNARKSRHRPKKERKNTQGRPGHPRRKKGDSLDQRSSL